MKLKIPFMLHSVQAGFPSPADDYIESIIDIHDLFHINDTSTYFVRAEGHSMIKEGIMSGDVLCVRKDLQPKNGDIVIAAIDNEFTVKRYKKMGNRIIFEAANDDYPDIEPSDMQDIQIWGVVTGLARSLKRFT